jgi:hypothetical protein
VDTIRFHFEKDEKWLISTKILIAVSLFTPRYCLLEKNEIICNYEHCQVLEELYKSTMTTASGPVQFTEDYWKELQTCQKKKFLFPKVNMKAYICILIPLNILANAVL